MLFRSADLVGAYALGRRAGQNDPGGCPAPDPWLDPSVFTVVVTDGVASISGRVKRRSAAEMVERAVSMVPGIMDVHADVTWELDDSRIEPSSVDPVFPSTRRLDPARSAGVSSGRGVGGRLAPRAGRRPAETRGTANDPEGPMPSVVDAISDVPSVDAISGRSIR